MTGNPNHGKDGKFASGHNAGEGNRAVAKHVANQHKETISHKATRYALTAAIAPAATVAIGGIIAARGVHHVMRKIQGKSSPYSPGMLVKKRAKA